MEIWHTLNWVPLMEVYFLPFPPETRNVGDYFVLWNFISVISWQICLRYTNNYWFFHILYFSRATNFPHCNVFSLQIQQFLLKTFFFFFLFNLSVLAVSIFLNVLQYVDESEYAQVIRWKIFFCFCVYMQNRMKSGLTGLFAVSVKQMCTFPNTLLWVQSLI